MLLSFGARNVFSFKEGFELNLTLDGNCPRDISNSKSFANIMAIKGANTAGKTSVLKTLDFILEFGASSFKNDNDFQIEFNSYFRNNNPSNMFISFAVGENNYTYEIELTIDKIISEFIYKNDDLVIERKNNEFVHIDDEYKDISIIKLKDKASLISTAKQYEMDSIEEIELFFVSKISNVNFFGLRDEFINYKRVSKTYKENENTFNFAKHILVNTDTGITDILIKDSEDEETKDKEYFPIFQYKVNDEEKYLSYFDQSNGVKLLYKQLAAYQLILSTGGILILDEFDINLHPDILPLLLDLFDDPKNNINDAQLIFTTHNTEIMEKLKKYRTVIVNKEDNESFLYRLDELNGEVIRNDRPLTPIYNSGRIGGKPKPTL